MVLLSIKPKFVNLIINGDKKYEFRKTIFKTNVDKAYIYSSSPDKHIIGYFFIEEIIEDHPLKLWKKFKKHAGINESDFFSYFSGKDNGYAIKIGHIEIFEFPLDPNDIFENFYPPQSFYYIDDDIFSHHANKFEKSYNTA